VSCIKGTRAGEIIAVLEKLPLKDRRIVREVTLYMESNIALSIRLCVPYAVLVTNRFHVVKLSYRCAKTLKS
jgi:transposase